MTTSGWSHRTSRSKRINRPKTAAADCLRQALGKRGVDAPEGEWAPSRQPHADDQHQLGARRPDPNRNRQDQQEEGQVGPHIYPPPADPVGQPAAGQHREKERPLPPMPAAKPTRAAMCSVCWA